MSGLHVPSLDRLIIELSKLPGIGEKTAQRLALNLMKFSDQDILNLRQSLQDIKTKVRLCDSCYAYTEELDQCVLCQDPKRSQNLICVVEQASDISPMEASGVFKGLYHVLHGVISPLHGIGPERLKIKELLQRLNNRAAAEPRPELILALDADLEGDTTSLYLASQLEDVDIKITRLAQGVPIGGHLDYIDSRTLGRALENRTLF